MPPVPGKRLWVEGQLLCELHAHQRRQAEQQGIGDERRRKVAMQSSPGGREKSTAGAVPQQGEADRGCNQMVPVDDGEQAGQQDLIRQRRRRNQADSSQGRGVCRKFHGFALHRIGWCVVQCFPVTGTKVTGMSSRVVTTPSASRLTRTSFCVT